MVLVQEPSTAKFDSMPRSAIDAGLADIVAPVETVRERSSPICSRLQPSARSEVVLEDKTQGALEKIIVLLRTQTGNDFSHYKRNTLYRRVDRHMGIHQIAKMAGYVRYLQQNSPNWTCSSKNCSSV